MVEMENKMNIESTKSKSLKMELDSMNIKTISSDQNQHILSIDMSEFLANYRDIYEDLK